MTPDDGTVATEQTRVSDKETIPVGLSPTTPRRSRLREVAVVGLGTLLASALGVLARLWMRLVAVRPEFTWAGTLGIIIGFTIFGLTQSLGALARRRGWRPWASRMGRCAAAIGMLPLFVAAGAQMMPTVIFGGLAAWQVHWPKPARLVCAIVAALPALVVGHGIVDDFGRSLHSVAGVVGMLGVYAAIVCATRPTMSRPTHACSGASPGPMVVRELRVGRIRRGRRAARRCDRIDTSR